MLHFANPWPPFNVTYYLNTVSDVFEVVTIFHSQLFDVGTVITYFKHFERFLRNKRRTHLNLNRFFPDTSSSFDAISSAKSFKIRYIETCNKAERTYVFTTILDKRLVKLNSFKLPTAHKIGFFHLNM